MSVLSLLGSIFLQLMLAYALFMLVAFSACGLAGNPRLAPWQRTLLNRCMLLVPGSAAGVAVWLPVLHVLDSRYLSLWWNVLPLVVGALYLLLLTGLIRSLR